MYRVAQIILNILTLCMLCSCEQPKKSLLPWRELAQFYQARFPTDWQVVENEGGLTNSIEPAATLLLPHETKITLHLFREEVSPQSQVARWQKSFPKATITPLSHGGYQGLLMEAEGLIAVAMQLSPHYARRFPDYTLKATGNVALFKKEILAFMNSFELVDEL